jgi:plasmid stabilization system protein ParE
MNRPLIIRPEAESDLQDIHEYLRKEAGRARIKFEKRLAKRFALIESMPYLFGKIWRVIRAVPVPGFEYVIYYIVTKRQIEVIAVMHGHRETSAWKSRL